MVSAQVNSREYCVHKMQPGETTHDSSVLNIWWPSTSNLTFMALELHCDTWKTDHLAPQVTNMSHTSCTIDTAQRTQCPWAALSREACLQSSVLGALLSTQQSKPHQSPSKLGVGTSEADHLWKSTLIPRPVLITNTLFVKQLGLQLSLTLTVLADALRPICLDQLAALAGEQDLKIKKRILQALASQQDWSRVPTMATMSYVHETQTVYNVVQNSQMVCWAKKERMVSVQGVKRSACCCLKGARAVHSEIICFSSPIAPLLQAKQTLLQ